MSKKAKKKLQLEIASTLSTSIAGLKKNLSDKKFERNIRRASRMLVTGAKSETKSKLIPKKATKKKKELVASE